VDEYFVFTFKCERMILGERIKKGTFRPCISDYILKNEEKIVPLPSSTIEMALKHYLGFDKKIIAVGYLTEYKREIFEFSPSDIVIGTAKLPLSAEFFSQVGGIFFVKKTEHIQSEKVLCEVKILRLGGMKSKGFWKLCC